MPVVCVQKLGLRTRMPLSGLADFQIWIINQYSFPDIENKSRSFSEMENYRCTFPDIENCRVVFQIWKTIAAVVFHFKETVAKQYCSTVVYHLFSV